MSTTTTDVNGEFDTQRAEQITRIEGINASAGQREAQRQETWDRKVTDGRLIPLGGGRFRVSEPGSWDNNEIFYARETRIDGQAMVIPMPEHGLAVNEDGTTRFYGRRPEWTKVGQIIPEGVSGVREVLRLGGIDWETEKVPSQYRFNRKLVTDERTWHNVRKDTGYSLGAVGSIYQPFQNWQAADFLHEIVADHGVVFETAGELRDGETVFISLRLPQNIIVDEGGVTDEIMQYLMWSNNHAGKGKAKVVVTPWRPRCGNTHNFALRDAGRSAGISHSGDLAAKTEMARKALGMSEDYFAALAAEETTLARTGLTLGQFDKVIAEVWAEKDEPTKREAGISDRRKDTLHDLFARYSVELGQTAYAAENAFTDFWDHVAPRRALGDSMAAARATAIVEDDDMKPKSLVHAKLLTLSSR